MAMDVVRTYVLHHPFLRPQPPQSPTRQLDPGVCDAARRTGRYYIMSSYKTAIHDTPASFACLVACIVCMVSHTVSLAYESFAASWASRSSWLPLAAGPCVQCSRQGCTCVRHGVTVTCRPGRRGLCAGARHDVDLLRLICHVRTRGPGRAK